MAMKSETIGTHLSKIQVIVMAAGLSRRFGSNKLKASFKGKMLVVWCFEALKASGCPPNQVTVVWNDPEIAQVASRYGFRTCFNPNPHEGQSGSIRLGLAASGSAEAFLFMTADQPLLGGHSLSGMMAAFEYGSGKILMASWQGQAGNPVIFDQSYKDALMALEGDNGGKRVINAHREALVYYEVNRKEELMDVDHVEDFEKISRL